MRRDFSIARSYRLPFILDAFYGVLQLAVYFFISRTFGDNPPAHLDGAPSYFAFAAVGMIVALVADSASDGIAFKVREEQLTGTFEAIAVQPIVAAQLCFGLVGFPFLFAMIRSLFYLLIAGIWMNLDLSKTSWIGLLLVLFTGAAALATLGIIAGAVVLVLKRGEVLAGMVVFAITLVSGSVFPVSSLPHWLRVIGSVMPLRFAFDGVRHALFTGSGWLSDCAVLAGFSIVGLPLAIGAFTYGLSIARRNGTLAQY